jgi:glycosyltransferase involved in cell wall biosynthesis
MQGYRGKWHFTETIDGVTVIRTWIFVPRSRGAVARLLNYFSFVATSCLSLLRQPAADYLFCESPPLFLGITAVAVSKWKNMKLIFNVSDLWPESAEKLGFVRNRWILYLAYRLEGWIYRNAYLVSGQTRGIVSNINQRFPNVKTLWYPNGIDVDRFRNTGVRENWRNRWGVTGDEFVVLYAGVIGHAQGLEIVIRAATRLKERPVRFVLVGDGPEKEKLQSMVSGSQLVNVLMIPSVEKGKIPSLIESCDACLVPLRKLELFKGAVPSKLFEPLAIGKPILLGVEGESYDLFIREAKSGLAYEPENGDDLARQIQYLMDNPEERIRLGRQGKEYIMQHYPRERLHEKLLAALDA